MSKQRPIGPIDVICNGDLVTDRITQFSGVVTAMTQYLDGRIQVCVQSCELECGKPLEYWFDEGRLIIKQAGAFYADKRPEGIGFRI